MSKNRSKGERRGPYFAAANSGRGFVSFYKDVFGGKALARRYLIKGGPGTGKSHFLGRVAEYALNAGRDVAFYRCSSDPDSLDGIVIDGMIAVLDATAPHSMEATLPGARDEIIDLGAFWDGEALAASAARIEELNHSKREAYGRAYRFLSAALEVEEANRSLIESAIRREKLERAVDRLCRQLPEGISFAAEPCLTEAIGMRGRARFDSLVREADRVYWIEENDGEASFYLAALAQRAVEKRWRMQVSYDPLCPDRIRGLLLCDSGICFAATDAPADRSLGERINMKRFLDHDALAACRARLRSNRRLKEALIDSAVESFGQAGEHHFALEQIYGACMDFEAENRFLESFCQDKLKAYL